MQLSGRTLFGSGSGWASSAVDQAYTAVQACRLTSTVRAIDSSQSSQASGSGTSTSSSADADDWRKATSQVFSIRPSSLSPLHLQYNRDQEVKARIRLLLSQLSAHRVLANQLEGLDDEQISRATRYRIEQLRTLSMDLHSLLLPKSMFRPYPSTCSNSKLAFGYYAKLEQQAASAIEDMQALKAVGLGQASVWDVWRSEYADKYQGMPGLPDLATIFSSGSSHAAAEKSELASSQSGTDPAGQPTAGKQAATSNPQHGAYLDLNGVAHAEGKRKRSKASVWLHAAGRRDASIRINGLLLEEYFKDLNHRLHVLRPLFMVGGSSRFGADVKVRGGGLSGQAQAIRTALARALALTAPSQGMRALKQLAVWDGRKVERKKFARKKARRGFQWVKR